MKINKFLKTLPRRTLKFCLVSSGYLRNRRSNNFHIVEDGQLYRSAQPTPDSLRDYAASLGLKTIINLRGKCVNDDWYGKEIEEARRLGLQHIDFKMSARKELSTDDVERLVAVLRDAPKPALIHCKAGADRCGLVAAIYLHQVAGVEMQVAKRQISHLYGHVGIPYLSKTYAMDRTWKRLENLYRLDEQQLATL